MLSTRTGKYAHSGKAGDAGACFPDAVVDAVMDAARDTLPQTYKAHVAQDAEFALLHTPTPHLPERTVPFEESRDLILAALDEFDENLGQKAREIFADEKRWMLTDVPPGECKIAQCRPAGCTGKGAENPTSHAIVEFQYDGTIDATIYLAHEVGHAIADEYQNDAGRTYRDNPEYMAETQAYFVQHIVYDSLKKSDDPTLAGAAERHFTATMTKNLYLLPMALNAMEARDALGKGQEISPTATLKQWFGDAMDRHERAGEMLETIQGVAKAGHDKTMPDDLRESLDNQVTRIHCRPMGLAVASGIVSKLQEADETTRRKTGEILLGKSGVANINKALARAGIEYDGDMRKMAQSTLNNATGYLHARANVPGVSRAQQHSRLRHA